MRTRLSTNEDVKDVGRGCILSSLLAISCLYVFVSVVTSFASLRAFGLKCSESSSHNHFESDRVAKKKVNTDTSTNNHR